MQLMLYVIKTLLKVVYSNILIQYTLQLCITVAILYIALLYYSYTILYCTITRLCYTQNVAAQHNCTLLLHSFHSIYKVRYTIFTSYMVFQRSSPQYHSTTLHRNSLNVFLKLFFSPTVTRQIIDYRKLFIALSLTCILITLNTLYKIDNESNCVVCSPNCVNESQRSVGLPGISE